MHLKPDENVQIARLLGFLLLGERVAARVAERQAALATQPRARRFLLQQARQERLHVAVFYSAQQWLAPRGTQGLSLTALQRYEALEVCALARADFDESLLALQVILEGLGDVVLGNLDYGLARRGMGFAKLRRLLLQQEQTHRAFGVRMLEQRFKSEDFSVERLRVSAEKYLELVDVMLRELGDLFAHFDENSPQYRVAFRANLPAWLQHA